MKDDIYIYIGFVAVLFAALLVYMCVCCTGCCLCGTPRYSENAKLIVNTKKPKFELIV